MLVWHKNSQFISQSKHELKKRGHGQTKRVNQKIKKLLRIRQADTISSVL